MKIRLGDTEIGLGRYLALWGAVALVFAVQRIVHDALLGHLWPPGVYLRWSIVQWSTWPQAEPSFSAQPLEASLMFSAIANALR